MLQTNQPSTANLITRVITLLSVAVWSEIQKRSIVSYQIMLNHILKISVNHRSYWKVLLQTQHISRTATLRSSLDSVKDTCAAWGLYQLAYVEGVAW